MHDLGDRIRNDASFFSANSARFARSAASKSLCFTRSIEAGRRGFGETVPSWFTGALHTGATGRVGSCVVCPSRSGAPSRGRAESGRRETGAHEESVVRERLTTRSDRSRHRSGRTRAGRWRRAARIPGRDPEKAVPRWGSTNTWMRPVLPAAGDLAHVADRAGVEVGRIEFPGVFTARTRLRGVVAEIVEAERDRSARRCD